MAQDPQIVLFSATFAEVVRTFAVRFAPGANEIRLKQEELSLDAIKQFFMGGSRVLLILGARHLCLLRVAMGQQIARMRVTSTRYWSNCTTC